MEEKEAKRIYENINKQLEQLTRLLEKICKKNNATYTMSLSYDHIYNYNKLKLEIEHKITWF